MKSVTADLIWFPIFLAFIAPGCRTNVPTMADLRFGGEVVSSIELHASVVNWAHQGTNVSILCRAVLLNRGRRVTAVGTPQNWYLWARRAGDTSLLTAGEVLSGRAALLHRDVEEAECGAFRLRLLYPSSWNPKDETPPYEREAVVKFFQCMVPGQYVDMAQYWLDVQCAFEHFDGVLKFATQHARLDLADGTRVLEVPR